MATRVPILQVSGLETIFSTHHGDVLAVDGVSFEVYAGEAVAIVGESGSGKSVTALSLLQLLEDSGQITGGKAVFQSVKSGKVDLLQLSEKQLQKIRGSEISMVFQEPMSSLNPVYTCGKQVAEVLLLHTSLSKKEVKESVITLFKQVRLSNPEQIYAAYPHQISGGQTQRVMIAMAMACEPSVLIADEPTTALDVTVQARVLQLIDELRVKANMAVLFITHDLGVVAEIAERVLVMYQGKIVEQGKIADVFANPQHPYTKGLLACRPKLTDKPQTKLLTVADFMQGKVNERGEHSEEKSRLPEDGKAEPKAHLTNTDQLLPLLRVENLKVYYPIEQGLLGWSKKFLKAVDDVSFEVLPGETIGLVGESGCGKTTLGRALLGLVKATDGRIVFNSRDIAKLNDEEMRKSRRDIQMIFQDPYASLNPMHTVGEAIMEPMRVHKLYSSNRERHGKVLELLDKVGLEAKHFHRYPHEFSGGQRQRICIARALALQPKCLICDEAVSALDVSVQAQVLNLLNRLKQEFQIACIFITHDLSVAKYMSDHILVMNKGRIVERGTPEQLYFNPQQEYTRTLIDAIPKGEPEDIAAAQNRRERLKLG